MIGEACLFARGCWVKIKTTMSGLGTFFPTVVEKKGGWLREREDEKRLGLHSPQREKRESGLAPDHNSMTGTSPDIKADDTLRTGERAAYRQRERGDVLSEDVNGECLSRYLCVKN